MKCYFGLRKKQNIKKMLDIYLEIYKLSLLSLHYVGCREFKGRQRNDFNATVTFYDT